MEVGLVSFTPRANMVAVSQVYGLLLTSEEVGLEATGRRERAGAAVRGARLLGGCAAVVLSLLAGEGVAEAEPRSEPKAPLEASPWRIRYDAARKDLTEGRFRRAEVEFRALALEGKTATDRQLALEMARLAVQYAEQDDAGLAGRHVGGRLGADIRTSDELTLLYTTAFLYGAGSGAWFLLETQPDTALTATLPFAAITAAPVIAVATLDGYKKFARGVPHAVASGLYVGLGEGAWISAYAQARARRIESVDPKSTLHWSPETVAAVLWTSATSGAVLGGAIGSSVITTPGRVSFTASTTIWSAAVVGLAVGGIHPDNGHRDERAYLAGGLGLNAGLASGLLLAGQVSPSVARVRLVDLFGLAGSLAATGSYLSLTSDVDVRLAEGIAAAGAVAGLTAGWILTSSMPKQLPTPDNARAASARSIEPTLVPVRGGAAIGVAGLL